MWASNFEVLSQEKPQSVMGHKREPLDFFAGGDFEFSGSFLFFGEAKRAETVVLDVVEATGGEINFFGEVTPTFSEKFS